MKKVLFSIFIALVAIFLSSNVFAQKLEFFGAGVGTKIHHVEVLESNIIEPTIGGILEIGYEFEGSEKSKLAKSITGEIFLGMPSVVFMSSSFKKGFATELVLKFNLETHAPNPLGAYAGVSVGHMGVLPVVSDGEKGNIIYHLGEDSYPEFLKMAKEKKRITENYTDVEVGVSYELDGLKFELGYGLLHKSIGITVKYNLRL